MLDLFIIVLIDDAGRPYRERFMPRLTVPKDLVVPFGQKLTLLVRDGEFNRVHAVAKEMAIIDSTSTDFDYLFFPFKLFDAAI